MYFDFREEEQIHKNNKIQYFKQIKPFTNNKLFNDIVSIRVDGNVALFYSKNTKICIGVSDICTKKLFVEI